MDKESIREKILEFIGSHTHCVLATTNEKGNPEAAVVEFVLAQGGEIIFDTSTAYRKYKNLIKNPHVAIAIGSGQENKGVQYEGIVRLLSGQELAIAKKIFFAKIPDAPKWEKEPDTVYFKISPKWLRMRDYTKNIMAEVEYLYV